MRLKLLYYGSIPDKVGEAVRCVASYMYPAGQPGWYARGKQILAGDLLHGAWDPGTLLD